MRWGCAVPSPHGEDRGGGGADQSRQGRRCRARTSPPPAVVLPLVPATAGPFVCPCRLRLVVLLAVSCRSVWGSGPLTEPQKTSGFGLLGSACCVLRCAMDVDDYHRRRKRSGSASKPPTSNENATPRRPRLQRNAHDASARRPRAAALRGGVMMSPGECSNGRLGLQ